MHAIASCTLDGSILVTLTQYYSVLAVLFLLCKKLLVLMPTRKDLLTILRVGTEQDKSEPVNLRVYPARVNSEGKIFVKFAPE